MTHDFNLRVQGAAPTPHGSGCSMHSCACSSCTSARYSFPHPNGQEIRRFMHAFPKWFSMLNSCTDTPHWLGHSVKRCVHRSFSWCSCSARDTSVPQPCGQKMGLLTQVRSWASLSPQGNEKPQRYSHGTGRREQLQ